MKGWTKFAVVWGLTIAVGAVILFHARITIPIALSPLVFYSLPIAAIMPKWILIAASLVAWVSGLLLYEDDS